MLFWLIIGIVSLIILVVSIIGIHYLIIDLLLLALSLIILGRMTYILMKKHRISVDLLMGIAGLATWYLHAYIEGFLIFALYSISELIEEFSELHARKKLSDIKEIIPLSVQVKIGNRFIEKRLDEVNVGDLVLVKPGNIVPVDGIIVDGYSSFDTSYITGEAEPLIIHRGGNVYSGYINKERLVIVKALKKPSESMLQLLIKEAERALERKASIQKFLEKFAQPYTFIVLLFFGVASFYLGLYKGLSILLAGCPSAFILSTSVATALSITILSGKSIIVRGGVVLEKASKLRTIILDKTGTITLGRMDIVGVKSYNGFNEDIVLRYAGGAAKASDHPISRVIAERSDLIPEKAVEYPGKGVEAIVDGAKVIIGSKNLILENNIVVPNSSNCGEGSIEVHVAIDDKYAGVICLEDKVTDEVFKTINELRKMNLRLIIASGDRVERVRKIASMLGIKEYYGELLPDEKRQLVIKMKREAGMVGFVGDGINDVEAIAEADVGMAIGSLRIVSNIGDVVFIKGISGLPKLLRFARKYMHTIYLAIIATSLVKLGAMMLGLAGLVPIWLVVALGDDGSTLLSIGMITYSLSRRI